jgi:acyl-coenzyme A synthetase/AMP-(fatty) acid ligase
MLAQADADAFVAQTNVPVVEVYGSTETGGIAERIRAQGDGDFKPFPPVKIQIQDHHLRLRSDYLSPELAIATGGYFELGDRVRATAGDRFELLGRNDGIVKVGGQRVDLEAVRQTLKQNPGVKDAVAISLPVGSSRENQIVALVEADAASLHVSALALEPLAHYARPRRIKMVAKIPLTAAGKYDRQAIVAIFQTGDR